METNYNIFLDQIISVESTDTVLIIYDENFNEHIDDFISSIIRFSTNISCYYLPTVLQLKILENTTEEDFSIPYILNNSIHSAGLAPY